MQSRGVVTTSDLTHVDLFAGIGGFSLALERAGAKTVAAVEIDKNCRKVLAGHWPGAALFSDIKDVSGDDLRAVGFVPERGVVTGGFPCQDLSIAGRGAGLAGERSGLFWEIVRLLDDLRPQWFILENVPRLLSINGGGDMAAVIKALVDLGYGIAWRVLDAQYFGVPQRRRRVFIVGCLGDSGRASAQVLFESQGVPGDSAPSGQTEQETAAGTGPSPDDGRAPVHVVGTPQTDQRGTVSADQAGGGQLVMETPIAFHMTQDPISGSVSPCLSGNAYIGVAEKASTLQGGGRRGYRIDAECAAGGHLIPTIDPVAALTSNGVGVSGPDDNQAQAGHLIVADTGDSRE